MLSATPTFDAVFSAHAKRVAFKGTKFKAAQAAPSLEDTRKSLDTRLLKVRKCCKGKRKRCQCAFQRLRDQPDFIQKVCEWRRSWKMTPRFMRRAALLQHLQRMRTVARSMKSQPSMLSDPGESHVCTWGGRHTLVLPHDNTRLVHSFLGHDFCQRAFAALTGVNAHLTQKIMKEGKLEVPKDTRPRRTRPRRDQMVAGIWIVAADLHSQSPFAKDAKSANEHEFHMPFHHKVCLWRLVLRLWKDAQVDGSTPSLQSLPSVQSQPFLSEPKYSLFRSVIVSPEFKSIVFHRVVDIGRCPKCEYFKWKMASVAVSLRGVWQDAFAKHHLLQIQQKRCYAADRARAAQDFPRTELYLGMDCGSGNEFVLPHLSAADREGPNKAIDGFATVPLKVCNGLIHGDRRSHVILSPGVVGATANHTCECLLIMINGCFIAHKVLPRILSLQFDGASTNKCMLVLAFMALYVLEGVFDMARARCEMENHAHDLYDSYHAIHAVQVRDSSFWHFEELRVLIKAAHARQDSHAKCPVVGHDVIVSNLWSLRDFWEWLCPGYTDEKTRGHALANAAFTSYAGIRHLRDFKIQLEAGSTDDNPSVGLWAKPYMTSKEYTYLGTLLSRKSVDTVTRNRSPAQQCREVSSQKTTRETKVLKHFCSLSPKASMQTNSPQRGSPTPLPSASETGNTSKTLKESWGLIGRCCLMSWVPSCGPSSPCHQVHQRRLQCKPLRSSQRDGAKLNGLSQHTTWMMTQMRCTRQ